MGYFCLLELILASTVFLRKRGSLSKQEELFEFQTLSSSETQVIIEDQDRELASSEAVDHLKPEDLTVYDYYFSVDENVTSGCSLLLYFAAGPCNANCCK